MDYIGLQAQTELANELTASDIDKLKLYLRMPHGIISMEVKGVQFLQALKSWRDFKSSLFKEALDAIGKSDLISIANRVKWMSEESAICSSHDQEEESPMKNLIYLLRSELSQDDLTNIYVAIEANPSEAVSFNFVFSKLLKREKSRKI